MTNQGGYNWSYNSSIESNFSLKYFYRIGSGLKLEVCHYSNPRLLFHIAVNQNYSTKAEDEYVIRGNDVLMKCKIPSFVSDYISVVGWIDNDFKEILSQQAVDSKI